MDFHRVHYIDASVLVKLIVKESGSDAIEKYMAAEYTSTFYATTLCFAEALGVLKLKYLRKDIDEETYFAAGDELRSYISDWIKLVNVDISDNTIFMEIEDTARRYRLDIVDAYQIVTIKKDYFSRFPNARPILITADGELAKAAKKEGLKVWNCLTEKLL